MVGLIVERTPEWMEHAACRGLDPDLFHPQRGDNVTMREALKICNGQRVRVRVGGRRRYIFVEEDRCPVRDECLAFALSLPKKDDSCGVWGGTTHKTRLRLRKAAEQENAIVQP